MQYEPKGVCETLERSCCPDRQWSTWLPNASCSSSTKYWYSDYYGGCVCSSLESCDGKEIVSSVSGKGVITCPGGHICSYTKVQLSSDACYNAMGCNAYTCTNFRIINKSILDYFYAGGNNPNMTCSVASGDNPYLWEDGQCWGYTVNRPETSGCSTPDSVEKCTYMCTKDLTEGNPSFSDTPLSEYV